MLQQRAAPPDDVEHLRDACWVARYIHRVCDQPKNVVRTTMQLRGDHSALQPHDSNQGSKLDTTCDQSKRTADNSSGCTCRLLCMRGVCVHVIKIQDMCVMTKRALNPPYDFFLPAPHAATSAIRASLVTTKSARIKPAYRIQAQEASRR